VIDGTAGWLHVGNLARNDAFGRALKARERSGARRRKLAILFAGATQKKRAALW